MNKKYIDYLQEISKEDLRKGLLGYGLFADKRPAIFTSKAFYDYCESMDFPTFEKVGRDYIRYESTRNTNVPRLLSIPSPLSYSNLCNCIVSNWAEIVRILGENTDGQKYKYSQIHLQKLKSKDHLFEMSLNYEDRDKNLMKSIQKIPIGNKYRVDADISNCFPSIYTHVISWALVGKEEAKRNKDKPSIWYNVIDFFSRNIKNGETNGLLIGPHVSNLLSEIVLCCVDKELCDKYQYVRNIDDFTCYVDSEDNAERFLLDLNDILKKYELNLNTKKTKITKLPINSDTNWVSSLNSFFIGDTYTDENKLVFKKQRLKAYLDLSISLAKETGNSAVYTYAIKTIANTVIGKDAKEYYIDLLHQLLCLYPYLVHWMEAYVFDVFDITTERIQKISQNLYDIGIKRHIYEACTFSLYWSIKYNFSLESNYVDDSINSSDCIFMLLAFLKAKRDKNRKARKIFKEKAKSLTDELDKYWIFVYEVLSKEELPKGGYRALKNKKISFIKSEFL